MDSAQQQYDKEQVREAEQRLMNYDFDMERAIPHADAMKRLGAGKQALGKTALRVVHLESALKDTVRELDRWEALGEEQGDAFMEILLAELAAIIKKPATGKWVKQDAGIRCCLLKDFDTAVYFRYTKTDKVLAFAGVSGAKKQS